MAFPEDFFQPPPSEDSFPIEDPVLYHHPLSPASTSHTPLQPAHHHQIAPMFIPCVYQDTTQNLYPNSYPQEVYPYGDYQPQNQVFGIYSPEQQPQQVVPPTIFNQPYPNHPQLFHHPNLVLAPNDFNVGTQGNSPTPPRSDADEIATRRAAVLSLRSVPEFMAGGNTPAHIQADLKRLYLANSWPAGSKRGARGGKNSYTCMWPEGHCNKTITRRDHMINHIKAHLGVKSFSCSLLKEDGQPCQSRFLRQDDLKRHNRIVHKNQRSNEDECDGNSSSPTVNRKKHKRRISTSSSSSSNGSMISFPFGYCKSENDDADYQPQPSSSYSRLMARRYGTSMSFQCLCVASGWLLPLGRVGSAC